MTSVQSSSASSSPLARLLPNQPKAHGQSEAAKPQRPDTFDMIVIGAGINGSGIARDAAERGLSVLLVDKNDLGAGTTAYSTRLIHGGLRYLENLEISLVRESLREREVLLENAPHLVRPLPLGIPIYKKDMTGKDWQFWNKESRGDLFAKLKRSRLGMFLGMVGYGTLSYDKTIPGFKFYSKEGFLKHFPGVNPKELVGGALYYDAQVNFPERICVENAIAAHETGNAVIKTHAKVVDILESNRQATGVALEDMLTGERMLANGRVIINASGTWVDGLSQLTQKLNPMAPVKQRMGGTKGSHIIVKKFPGGPERALYVEAQQDGRPYFIIPWQKEFYLIGTTDLKYNGDLDKVVADQDEIDYLIRETNLVLPEAHLKADDVLFTYSGVRPLPNSNASSTGKITRKHIIEDHANDAKHPLKNFVSIIGGKITTYRNLAEEAVDYSVKQYLKNNKSDCNTKEKPLPGGEGIAAVKAEKHKTKIHIYKQQEIPKITAQYGLTPEIADHLIDLYGSRYTNVLAMSNLDKSWLQPVKTGSRVLGAQVIYALESEFALTLIDVIRRIGENLNADVGLDIAEPVANLMAQYLNWTAEQKQQALADYRQWVGVFNLAHQPQKQPSFR